MTARQAAHYRLSRAQQRLWPHQTADPAYRVQALVELRGELRPEALRRALTGVVAGHDVLRAAGGTLREWPLFERDEIARYFDTSATGA